MRIALTVLLLFLTAGACGGCRASPEARLERLRAERVKADAEERDLLREIDRRQDRADERLDAYAAAVHAKYDAARRAYIGPSAESYRAAMSSPGPDGPDGPGEADAAFAERNASVERAKRAFTETDRRYSAILDPREQAYLDALGRKRAVYHEKCNLKRVHVMTEYEALRRKIDGEIAMLEARRY